MVVSPNKKRSSLEISANMSPVSYAYETEYQLLFFLFWYDSTGESN